MNEFKHRADYDPTVMAAIREGREADDIYVVYCSDCKAWSYWNQGSHCNCRFCLGDLHDDEAITLADYWTDSAYPCDEQKWFCPVCGSTNHQHCARGCASCDDPKSPMPRYASTFCGTCGKSFCIECFERHVCTAKVQ